MSPASYNPETTRCCPTLILEESQHDEDINSYKLVFNKSSTYNYILSSDDLLGKLQFRDLVSFHVPHETSPDILCYDISLLDWLGIAPADVNNRLKALLSPTSGMFFSSYNISFHGNILIYGPLVIEETLWVITFSLVVVFREAMKDAHVCAK